MNTDLRNYLWLVGCHFGRVVFAMLGMTLLARLLGPTGLGRWTMIMAAGTLLHLVLINWIQQDPLIRFGREEWVKKQTLETSWTMRLPFMATGAVFAAILLVLAPSTWTSHFFELSHVEVVLAAGVLVSLAISTESQSLQQVLGYMRRLAAVPMLISATSAIFYIALWHMPKIATLHLALSGTLLITILFWGTVAFGAARTGQLAQATWDSHLAKQALLFAWPILPTAILGYCVSWGNQVLIQRAFSAHEVGLYQSAFQVHTLMVALTVPLTTVILPRLIGRHAEDPAAMHRYVRSIAPTLLSLWLLIAMPMAALAPFAFHLIFGRSFEASLPILNAFLIATPLCGLGQLYTVLYTVQSRMGIMFWIMAIMATVNVLLAWVLVPAQTMVHVALAFGCALLLSQGMMWLYQQIILKEPFVNTSLLVVSALCLSVTQFFLYSLHNRLLWACGSLFLLGIVIRSRGLLDAGVLRQLFSGRLDLFGQKLELLLIGPRSS